MSQDEAPWNDPVPIETRIDDLGNGVYELWVGNAPVVKIDWLNGVRQCRWQVYGPSDLDRSIALMKGFLHLTALLGNEQRANVRPPDNSEAPAASPKGKLKWRTSKTIRRSKS